MKYIIVIKSTYRLRNNYHLNTAKKIDITDRIQDDEFLHLFFFHHRALFLHLNIRSRARITIISW